MWKGSKNIKTVTLHVSNCGKIKVRFLSIFKSNAKIIDKITNKRKHHFIFNFSDYMIITEYNHIRRTKLRILVEVLVMIVLVRIDNNTRYWLRQTDGRRIYNI